MKHTTMSSPMHTRSGSSLLPTTTQPQFPYRLAMPATLTTTSTTATTSTSSSTGIPSTTLSVVPSTAPAPVISPSSTSSTVSVSAMSTVNTSPSTVTSPVASVPSASSSSTAVASTFYLTTDPGIPGPGSFFGDGTQDPRDWIKTFQSWANIKNFSERTKIEIFKMLMKVNAARWIDTRCHLLMTSSLLSTILLSTIWRKQSGTINMSSLTQLNPYFHRRQQLYRQQEVDNLYNRHVLQEHGTQATNLLDNFHRKVHNNREQH